MLSTHADAILSAPSWITFDTTSLRQLFWADTISGLAYGSIYALIALGYTLVYGVLRLINFAHSEVFISGAFAAYFTLKLAGFSPGITPAAGTFEILAYLVLAGGV